jgi:TPR repeat protein
MHEAGAAEAEIAANPAEAARLYDLACRNRDGLGCHRLAGLKRGTTIGNPDLSAALRLDERACELDEAAACVDAAAQYGLGQGVAANVEKQGELLARACQLGHAGSCVGGVVGAAPAAPAAAAPAVAPTPPAAAPAAPATAAPNLVGAIVGGTAPPRPRDPALDPALMGYEIERGVNDQMRHLERCYARRVRRVPRLGGGVTVDFTVVRGGRVAEAIVVQNGTNDAWMGRCVQNVVRRMRFAEPRSPMVTVRRTFSFGG